MVGNSWGVLAFAPRIPPRLIGALVRLDDPRVPIAEVNRRVGAEAARLGLTRPSYQRVRELVRVSRRLRARKGPSTARVLWDVANQFRPPVAILEHFSGSGVLVRGP